MIRLLLTLLLVLAGPHLASGQGTGQEAGQGTGQGPGDIKRLWFEVRLTPETALATGAWLGGQLVLDVKLVSSDPFKRLRLQIPRIEGARVESLVRPHTLQINVFGGKGYSHRARYAVFPRTGGTLIIPPLVVSGILQQRNGRTAQFKETYPEQRITVHPPVPDFPAGAWVVSGDVGLTERWSKDLNNIQAGDTVRRTVELTVAGVRADDLPPMDLQSGAGYRVLHTETAAETHKTKGGYVARVEQSWDIFIDSDDVFYIDPVKFLYWDPLRTDAMVIQAKAHRVEPVRRDAEALRASMREQIHDELLLKRIGVLALLGIPILGVLIVAVLAASSAMPSRADIRLWRAARRARSPLGFYDAFQAWARRSLADRPIVTEDQIARLGPEAHGDVRRMHRGLFGRDGGEVAPRAVSGRLIGAAIRLRMRRFSTAFGERLWRLLFGA